jgi:phosphoribosylformylglycinamidine synthase
VLQSAHDLADGGLAVALAECTFRNVSAGLGAAIELPGALDPHVALFSETPSRMLVTTRDDKALAALAQTHGVPCARIGSVGGDRLSVMRGGAALIDEPVTDLLEAWTRLERDLSTR